jgi:hypothetical protein
VSEDDRGPDHWTDLLPSGGDAALEQDQCQRDDADETCRFVTREVDPSCPIGADRHAEPEEQDERRQFEPCCDEGHEESRG